MATRPWRFADNISRANLYQPAQITQFELKVMELGLTEEQIPRSRQLRKWVERNADRYYVPEDLLTTWNITLDDNMLKLDRESGCVAKEARKVCLAM